MKSSALQMFYQTVKSDENQDIFIKPLCDFFKIDPENQGDRIKNDPILAKSSGKKPMKSLFGDNYPRVCLDKKGFLRWIQILNPNIIDESLRDAFLIYQELIFDFLMGSAEEHRMIAELNTRKHTLKSEYSRIGNEIQRVEKELQSAIDCRYQYSLTFNGQTQTTTQ